MSTMPTDTKATATTANVAAKKKTIVKNDDTEKGDVVDNKDNYDMKTLKWNAPRAPGGNSYAYYQTIACRVIRASDGHWAELPRQSIPLDKAQEIVGGYIEVLRVQDDEHPNRILIVNEDGTSICHLTPI
jgi:hypothetical protein